MLRILRTGAGTASGESSVDNEIIYARGLRCFSWVRWVEDYKMMYITVADVTHRHHWQ
jgi:hypothetical protein